MPKKRLADEQGSGLVEYALVFIIFMTMLFGICSFGHALYAYHFVSHAAKSAARWAAVNGSTCADDGPPGTCAAPAVEQNVKDYVTGQVPSGIDGSKVTTAVACGVADKGVCLGSDGAPSTSTCTGTTSNAPGCAVQVQVSYTFNFIFPLVSTAPLTVSSSSEMVIAH